METPIYEFIRFVKLTEGTKMSKTQRITLFIITLGLLFIIFKLATGNWTPASETFVIIFAALIMLSFVTLFLEHFFTKPTDVLASTISILLLLSPLHSQLSKLGIWYEIFYVYNVILLLAALIALLLVDKEKSSSSLQNKVASNLKRFAVFFGNGRWLYFCLFFLTLIFYVNNQTKAFIWLFFYSAVIILIDPKKFVLQTMFKKRTNSTDIGEIFGVQSKNTFLAKLYKERLPVKCFDFVEFRHTVSEQDYKGLIIDNYILNQEQWIKILCDPSIRDSLSNQTSSNISKNNVVYKIASEHDNNFLKRFVGIVVEQSTIEKIKFEYAAKVPVSEGDLLVVQMGSTKVLYQIVQGLTDTESLDTKNESGFVIGEAIQMGVWDSKRRTFEKYGWVPDVNTPVLLAPKIDIYESKEGEQQIGTIPHTNYPILMNISEAVNHHIAILGITGSGKSVFARNLIRRIILENIKIICVDFTGEYVSKLEDLNPVLIIHNQQGMEEIEKLIAQKEDTKSKQEVLDYKDRIYQRLSQYIQEFVDSENSLSVFELPDLSNTSFILEFTQMFLDGVFKCVKKSNDKKVCIVIEEAHTVVPETSSLGDFGDYGANKALVNKIGQIALQGRKYGVGFIIIAQRTANVSKTVLTQCNSIIAFQQFDKTGTEFLSNYMGIEMAKALPNLGLYQAVAVGKGFRTGVPIIFQVPEIREPNQKQPDNAS